MAAQCRTGPCPAVHPRIDPELLEIMVCPACHGSLEPPEESGIACGRCGRVYPIRDGIPVMLVEEAGPPRSGDAPE